MGEFGMANSKKSPVHSEKKKTEHTEKKSASKSQTEVLPQCPGLVIMDRRKNQDRRTGIERRKQNLPVSVERRVGERRAKVNRRRQIDPTTCERDYTSEEIEFMNALDNYKRHSGRMFPTCSEILEVLKSLGYEKRSPSPALDTSTTPIPTNLVLPNTGTEEAFSITDPPLHNL